MTTLLFVLLTAFAVACVAYAVLLPSLQKEAAIEKRMQSSGLRSRDKSGRQTLDKSKESERRKKNVQETLKDLEQRQNVDKQKPPLKVQIRQAGLDVDVRKFYMFSILAGCALALIAFVLRAPLYAVGGALIVGSLGVPRWYLKRRVKKRIKAFLNEFPNALEIIVRAVRSGLPINDGVRLIAVEAKEPVKTEFRRIVEAQQMGMPLPEAALKMSETIPCPEANFFGIVLQIQQQAGGSLSEALGNLAKVLRERKKMLAKVQAMSMEAKASGGIIGSLPILVGLAVYVMTPDYLMPLFTTTTGNLILAGAATWMGIGIFVMRAMMDFEV
ncbi:type II secretion system F family protein [Limoniibacter endophyticus]|uniref:Pilus assembly protein n=1 Tax=Limoniibacter endophyticus TaxID=1565040 RepID=A0A8J3GGR2_9HYPH|nr:type II secretion system F family protein [Limoniibacter endophyticus]GHC67165.1 pilus assembly protein [Limoniibacter endophyticus]